MTRIASREELQMQELMLKKLSPELRQKLSACGGSISVNMDIGSFEVTGNCPDEIKAEIMAVLKQE
ncbi:hypothetical protein [Mucilaginibacter myungsuensis]|uniref:Uncharacterized protein n=1 Tax=Mucilaginibacter myungsuensis TaxID=649104 RepID=A0A929KUT0_9SPHI|nr:hypothetical protein [Mucilaginibacter myungsuensis]MBE9661959.1 hypothetical protein [Mucilaginibacter myungsuensis]MDN3599608.1 hypothetical protein [Mucilaginibacter myungsuensis]